MLAKLFPGRYPKSIGGFPSIPLGQTNLIVNSAHAQTHVDEIRLDMAALFVPHHLQARIEFEHSKSDVYILNTAQFNR